MVAYGDAMLEGRKSATAIRQDLAISYAQWKRLVQKLRDPSSSLTKALEKHKVTFKTEGVGRGQRASFVKMPD